MGTADIAPRIVDGEPYCTGVDCPAWPRNDLLSCKHNHAGVCVEAIHRQRDERTAERDTARQELCEADAAVGLGEGVGLDHYTKGVVGAEGRLGNDIRKRAAEYATSRNWFYLYEK
jgi:hypothetical protein